MREIPFITGMVAVLSLPVLVMASCDQTAPSEAGSEPEETTVNSEALQWDDSERKALFGDEGVTIDGTKWTLASLSDTFDADLTIEKAKSLFGESPIVEEEGENTLLTYIIETNDVYVPGVRMTMVDLLFVGQKLEDVRIRFATYSQ